jgi:hypothetical protein
MILEGIIDECGWLYVRRVLRVEVNGCINICLVDAEDEIISAVG